MFTWVYGHGFEDGQVCVKETGEQILKKCCEVVMHKCIKHTQSHKFLRKLFRIKSPSDNVRRLARVMEEYKTEHEYKVLRVNNQTKKALQRLQKALKEM